jgi:hypothetical protein
VPPFSFVTRFLRSVHLQFVTLQHPPPPGPDLPHSCNRKVTREFVAVPLRGLRQQARPKRVPYHTASRPAGSAVLVSWQYAICFYCDFSWFSSALPVNRFRIAPSKGPNRVDVSRLSPDDWNRSGFRNVVVCTYYSSDDGRSPHRQNNIESSINWLGSVAET